MDPGRWFRHFLSPGCIDVSGGCLGIVVSAGLLVLLCRQSPSQQRSWCKLRCWGQWSQWRWLSSCSLRRPIYDLKPYLQEKTIVVQRFGVGGSLPRVYSFDPLFWGAGPGFWQLGLLGTILLPIFTCLAGYSAMGTANLSDVGVLLDKPMETSPVESPRSLP
ncbi:hypothetical protein Pyn_36578 [Prunus yedoensis var. nudiflora]|uniref:Uncharacterized protein n=1 Tax=Prunus yedoensis var. nudiflora TaxID=2094558 RepID=A0A314XKI1_PRUYE|nr:hypothetical protein Pyn_36578 [Prunus yedoensis var. nudiflora]